MGWFDWFDWFGGPERVPPTPGEWPIPKVEPVLPGLLPREVVMAKQYKVKYTLHDEGDLIVINMENAEEENGLPRTSTKMAPDAAEVLAVCILARVDAVRRRQALDERGHGVRCALHIDPKGACDCAKSRGEGAIP